MKLTVTDANSVQQGVITPGVEAVQDHSNTITSTGIAQVLLAANALRSGWFVQNLSPTNPMYVNDLGVASTVHGSIRVPPLGTFPPAGYPLVTSAVSILGTAADEYTCREW